jgi:signal transduction histidine kinase
VPATLTELQAGVREALDQLRRLAHGIHPPELSDHGLVEAIEGRSARLPIRVTVECPPEVRSSRFDDRVEGAAYLFVSEALTNVVKHAVTDHARVRIDNVGDHLLVEVVDAGRGFDGVDATTSPGLRGLADRVEGLGGTMTVETSPGCGTAVRASLPLGVRTQR